MLRSIVDDAPAAICFMVGNVHSSCFNTWGLCIYLCGGEFQSRDKNFRDSAVDPPAKVDFEFSQFLLGENTVANLVMVKERLCLGCFFPIGSTRNRWHMVLPLISGGFVTKDAKAV